jgi:dCTP deaminase
MILTGNEIAAQVRNGAIKLDPFSSDQMNPNSYNYRLGGTLKVVDQSEPLDPTQQNDAAEIAIPWDGYVLRPGRFYLGHTHEVIGSRDFVPVLIGRSSMGRLGLFLQISADLGNLGACHRWTLELYAVRPIIVYAAMIIGQVSFWSIEGGAEHYAGVLGFSNRPTFPPPIPCWKAAQPGQL